MAGLESRNWTANDPDEEKVVQNQGSDRLLGFPNAAVPSIWTEFGLPKQCSELTWRPSMLGWQLGT
jgi:hypothetical protein